MAILKSTSLKGRVESLLINEDSANLTTARVEAVAVSFAGLEGDVHSGLTRSSCVRVKKQYPVGTEIRNTRQISLVSVEELAVIAKKMGVDQIKPEWVGANLCVEGIDALTGLKPSSRLLFEGGVAIVIDMENEPCRFPGDIIDQTYPGQGKKFASAAMGLRGLTGWVERPGSLASGEVFEVHQPVSRP